MFKFKQFTINQNKTAMKVGTDGVLLGAWADLQNAKKILDIGSGTGLLSLMAAQRSSASITAIEIEENAYRQTVENFKNSVWNDRLNAINTSFQYFHTKTKNHYDHIICNPPFFENSQKNPDLNKTTARHNDKLPFDELLIGVKYILTKNGKFSVILPYETGLNFIEKAEKLSLFCIRFTEVKPNFAKPPKRILLEFSKIQSIIQKNTITIEKEKRHDYTKEYIELTKDFYLKM